MSSEIYSESISRIQKNKKSLEKELDVKITFKGKNICIVGKAINEYIACKCIEAINLGFKVPQTINLKEEDCIFETIHIKDITRRSDLERIRGRIIGKHGKTKELIENLSDCLISVHDNCIGIIGKAENIEKCIQAIKSIIQGSKQSKVYSYLERERTKAKRERFEDLGLKNPKTRKRAKK